MVHGIAPRRESTAITDSLAALPARRQNEQKETKETKTSGASRRQAVNQVLERSLSFVDDDRGRHRFFLWFMGVGDARATHFPRVRGHSFATAHSFQHAIDGGLQVSLNLIPGRPEYHGRCK
jgi:hypothetical protein